MVEYLYSTPARPVYTVADRALGRWGVPFRTYLLHVTCYYLFTRPPRDSLCKFQFLRSRVAQLNQQNFSHSQRNFSNTSFFWNNPSLILPQVLIRCSKKYSSKKQICRSRACIISHVGICNKICKRFYVPVVSHM